MASINHLPNELLPLIFKHLDLKDLPNCRLVSQNWKFFIDEVKIKQLVISNRDYSYSYRTWYKTKTKITSRNSIAFSKIYRCPYVLAHLERLRIDETIYSNRFNLNGFLAMFPKLCHLEIFWIKGDNTSINLDLPASLKTICLDVARLKLHLNSPQLQNVFCGSDIRNIKFSHPESIKNLKIDALENDRDIIYDDLQVFPNVECFHCGDYSYTLYDGDLDLIQLFPNAKKFRFELGAMDDDEDFDKLESVINNVIDQKNILGRTDLKIFCDGSKMVNRNSFRRYAYSG